MVRTLPCHGRGRGFESRPLRIIKQPGLRQVVLLYVEKDGTRKAERCPRRNSGAEGREPGSRPSERKRARAVTESRLHRGSGTRTRQERDKVAAAIPVAIDFKNKKSSYRTK